MEYGYDDVDASAHLGGKQHPPKVPWSGNMAWLSKTGQVNVSFRQYSARQLEGLVAKAMAGNPYAQYKLGLVFEFGQQSLHIRPDPQRAFAYYLAASQSPNQDMARFRLGKCYAAGFGTTKDPMAALSLFVPLAEQGDERAQVQAGQCSEDLCNYEWAYRYYDMAACNGNWAGLHKTGILLLQGQGIPQDISLAIERLSQAANCGYYLSDEVLGDYYFYAGRHKEALFHLRRAVEKCHFDDCGQSAYHIGECYEWGLGVDRNLDTARQYYEKARRWKCPGADLKCRQLGQGGSPFSITPLDDWIYATSKSASSSPRLSSSPPTTSAPSIAAIRPAIPSIPSTALLDSSALDDELDLAKLVTDACSQLKVDSSRSQSCAIVYNNKVGSSELDASGRTAIGA